MAYRKNLLEVSYHYDDDCGIYQVGEIDFGICGVLDDYLKTYGRKGKDDILLMLMYLGYEVTRRWKEMADKCETDEQKYMSAAATPIHLEPISKGQ
jgi:hypothetical protein